MCAWDCIEGMDWVMSLSIFDADVEVGCMRCINVTSVAVRKWTEGLQPIFFWLSFMIVMKCNVC